MRMIRGIVAGLAFACPLLAGVAELQADEYGPVHHARRHCCYSPVHYGYYSNYDWGWRFGGTRRSWLGSGFVWAYPQPLWWW